MSREGTERLAITAGELHLGGRHVPLLSGEFHFWRTNPEHWDAILGAVAEAGIPIVASYLSWRRHESAPGSLDLAGSSDPRLDVRRFIERCATHGLLVHLKPGPWICAEEENGGYPDWLLDDRELWALDAAGDPILGYDPPWQHRVPSYLHPRYLGHARRWLRAVDRLLADLFYPRGPIVLVQLDNEPSYAFRDTMYGFDYHPTTIARFRRWLLRRYGSLGGVERAWGRPLARLDALDPPRAPAAPGPELSRRELDWIEFREWLIAEYLRRLRRYHETAGVGGAVFTANYNDHAVASVPQDGWRIARAIGGTGGPDLYYLPPLGGGDIERLARTVAIARAQDPVVAWAPEIQAGIWRTPGKTVGSSPDPTPEEQEFWWLAAIAFGLRGLNLYMLADRERWGLAPLRSDGSPGPLWPAVERLMALVRAIPTWGRLVPVAPVALYRHQRPGRQSYAVATSMERTEPKGADAVDLWNVAFGALLAAGHLPAVWDGRSAAPSGARAAVVVRPYLLGAREWNQLHRFAADGGRLILVAPAGTDFQRRFRPPRPPTGEILRVASIQQLPDALQRAGVGAPVTVDDRATLAVLGRADGTDILFLVRRGRFPATVSVRFAEVSYRALRPLTGGGGEASVGEDGSVRILLPARVVRAYLPTRTPSKGGPGAP